MRYGVLLERLPLEEGMPGYYYAYVPSLGLTTHGLGMEGALDAARDLVSLRKQAGLTEEDFNGL